MQALENIGQDTPPLGHTSQFGTLLVDIVPIKFATAAINIDLGGTEPTLALPGVTTDPEEENDEEGKIAIKELLGSTGGAFGTNRRDSSVELQRSVTRSGSHDSETYLSDQDNGDKGKTHIRAVHTANSFEGDFIEGVSVVEPSPAETNMGKANGAPSEKGSHAGQLQEPSKDGDSRSD